MLVMRRDGNSRALAGRMATFDEREVVVHTQEYLDLDRGTASEAYAAEAERRGGYSGRRRGPFDDPIRAQQAEPDPPLVDERLSDGFTGIG
jgi:hypothetical protein